MGTWFYRRNGVTEAAFVDGERLTPEEYEQRYGVESCGLQIIREIDPYLSPINDKPVMNRRERRDDLLRHNCVPYEPTLRHAF